MTYESTKSRHFTPIKQYSIYAENKVGRLNDVLGLFAVNNIHIMALSSVDSTDSSMIRLIVDYPEQASALLIEHNVIYGENEVIGVELNTEAELKKVTCALIEAEINIHYIYPFLMRPHGKSGLVLRLEDNDLAIEVLRRHRIKVLSQEDIAR
jgi:hypothetical protein